VAIISEKGTLIISQVGPYRWEAFKEHFLNVNLLNIWVDYQRGEEDGIRFTYMVYRDSIGIWSYISREIDKILVKIEHILKGDFNPVIPLPFPYGADKFKIVIETLNNTNFTGNLVIEARPDGRHFSNY